eukprot:2590516-Pyramimonas_sp.AAC.1
MYARSGHQSRKGEREYSRSGHQSRKGREYTCSGHQSRKGREYPQPILTTLLSGREWVPEAQFLL